MTTSSTQSIQTSSTYSTWPSVRRTNVIVEFFSGISYVGSVESYSELHYRVQQGRWSRGDSLRDIAPIRYGCDKRWMKKNVPRILWTYSEDDVSLYSEVSTTSTCSLKKATKKRMKVRAANKKKAAKKARKTGVPKSISVAKSTGGFSAFQMTTGFPDTIGEIAYHEYDGVVEI